MHPDSASFFTYKSIGGVPQTATERGNPDGLPIKKYNLDTIMSKNLKFSLHLRIAGC
jgi:hypothetical protein